MIAQAAAHDEAVDFRALRFAWLTSTARKRASDNALAAANQTLATASQRNTPAAMRDAAIGVLSLDYTDAGAQLSLVLACRALHDQACETQAQFVEQGMVKSILHDGDGESCDTGWAVTAAREEAFVLGIFTDRGSRQTQVTSAAGHTCDAVTITRLGQPNEVYFRIDAVLEDEAGHNK